MLLAIGALIVLTKQRHPVYAIVALLVARIALLAVHAPRDPLRIFDFELYGSKILGPFSKSPFDLLLTAATIAGIVVLLRPWIARIPLVLRVLLTGLAAWGYVLLIDNFVANSRVSAVPDHVMPASLVQGILFAAMLLLAYAVVGIAATIFARVRPGNVLVRVVGTALAIAALAYIPLELHGRAGARRFVSDTYAPHVAGEAGQLRTMIETTLTSEFERIDLGRIIPDDYRRMSMEDLAYALWLRSDLAQWRVPAVITIQDEFTRSPISRFGVGLPQFDEQTSSENEVLQLGSIRRVLLHHDFEVTVHGTTIGLGSVHVVNPADPGATAFADAYRDFFDASSGDTTMLYRQGEPAVYDKEGNAQSAVTYRLPQSAARYFQRLKPGTGVWVPSADPNVSELYVRRGENALYVFPLQVASPAQQIRRAGGVAVWALLAVVGALAWRSLPRLVALLRRVPVSLDFRARTSIYLT
ncbi:MAG TPA: hypothetical protein VHK90_05105, partial [Thermoanaerobaculia bacterium]|nr:hypothetical protein [Thermoanaerobaculia bacterium]